MSFQKILVLSFGGSLLYKDNKINYENLKILKEFVNKVKEKLFIVTGGGNLARELMNYLDDEIDKHNIGIEVTKLNAKFLSKYLGAKYIENPFEIERDYYFKSDYKIFITNGIYPGVTTDFDTVLLAYYLNQDFVLNITDVDFLYDKDPKKYKDAKPIKEISYRDILINFFHSSKPGENFIFDLDGLFFGYRRGIKIYIVGIKNLLRFLDFLYNNKEFIGTIIK